jgi:hypothetical protein
VPLVYLLGFAPLARFKRPPMPGHQYHHQA